MSETAKSGGVEACASITAPVSKHVVRMVADATAASDYRGNVRLRQTRFELRYQTAFRNALPMPPVHRGWAIAESTFSARARKHFVLFRGGD